MNGTQKKMKENERKKKNNENMKREKDLSRPSSPQNVNLILFWIRVPTINAKS